jgi:hypothetical protein
MGSGTQELHMKTIHYFVFVFSLSNLVQNNVFLQCSSPMRYLCGDIRLSVTTWVYRMLITPKLSFQVSWSRHLLNGIIISSLKKNGQIVATHPYKHASKFIFSFAEVFGTYIDTRYFQWGIYEYVALWINENFIA